jgi:hypothetical protein
MTVTAEVGAGEDFLNTVLEAVNDDHYNVYMVVAGEYGHLHVESIDEIVDD